MFELRVFVGGNPPVVSVHVNPMVPLALVAKRVSGGGGFDFTRAECWHNGVRQWELIVD